MKKGSISASSNYASSSATAGFKPYVCYIYEIKDNMFGISSKDGESSYEDVTYFRFGTATVSVCEVSGKGKVKVWETTLDTLTDYLNNSNPSKVFMYTQSAIVQNIIILK